jgi:hypothetical protein
MSDNSEHAASADGAAESQYTFDIYLLATVKVRGKDLHGARRNLRTELISVDLPDYTGRITNHIDVSSIEYLARHGLSRRATRRTSSQPRLSTMAAGSSSWNG